MANLPIPDATDSAEHKKRVEQVVLALQKVALERSRDNVATPELRTFLSCTSCHDNSCHAQ
jgi:hypothetical protein